MYTDIIFSSKKCNYKKTKHIFLYNLHHHPYVTNELNNIINKYIISVKKAFLMRPIYINVVFSKYFLKYNKCPCKISPLKTIFAPYDSFSFQ